MAMDDEDLNLRGEEIGWALRGTIDTMRQLALTAMTQAPRYQKQNALYEIVLASGWSDSDILAEIGPFNRGLPEDVRR